MKTGRPRSDKDVWSPEAGGEAKNALEPEGGGPCPNPDFGLLVPELEKNIFLFEGTQFTAICPGSLKTHTAGW